MLQTHRRNLTLRPHVWLDVRAEAGLRTVLWLVVVGSRRSLVFVESQQGEEGEERLSVTQQDGSRLGRRLTGPVRVQRSRDDEGKQIRRRKLTWLINCSVLESRPAGTSSFVQRPEDVMEERTAGQTADHMTMRALPVLLQVRLVLQHLWSGR